MTEPLYAAPYYYDIAFGWDPTEEVHLLREAFTAHATGTVRRVIEPACGTGRLAIALAMHGFEVIGYDLEPDMATYAADRARAMGLADRCRFEPGDMTTRIEDTPCDAAFNPVNSLGHLRTDDRIAEHLRCMAASLRPGAVYALQLTLAYDPADLPMSETWQTERGDVRIDSTWTVTLEDPATAERDLHYHLAITEAGRSSRIERTVTMRAWTVADLLRLFTDESRFESAGIIDPEGGEWTPDDPPTGADGAMWWLFRRTTAAP